ncbi:nardilysin-like [Varroa jacobsoni]|uniref:nardilysin-like n=1 Tax=Varroa jacobsoni TaxID=62625 RepID=UPI000BF79A22|nr:nardilysin-like [Varroa jacobsoni]
MEDSKLSTKPNLKRMTAKATIIKSESDRRSYRIIELKNGLRVTLISTARGVVDEGKRKSVRATTVNEGVKSQTNLTYLDPVTYYHEPGTFAAACLAVKCGTFDDLPDMEGTAHFVDHMILLGSAKYPKEDEYLRFIFNHGGSANAFAARETTLFQLEIIESALPEGLDRLANLFIEPKFNKEAIEREINALESEFQLRKSSDAFRLVELLSHLVGKDHPMGLFRWGNTHTLVTKPCERNVDVSNALRSFFKRHYLPDRMSLCVQSIRTLDQLEKLVEERFSKIPRSSSSDFSKSGPARIPVVRRAPFSQNPNFYKLHKVIPLQKELCVSFFWVLPPQKKFYKEKAIEYLTYIIGHECKDGLYDNLKKEGWALKLSAGVERDGFKDCSFCTIFSVEILLTPDGAQNVQGVTQYVHQFLHLVRKTCPQKQLWDELSAMGQAHFRFLSSVEPLEYVQDISLAMHNFTEQHYLCGSYLFLNYDPEHIQSLSELLTPEKCSIMLVHHAFGDEASSFQREPWMGVRYNVENYPSDWIRLWVDNPEFQKRFCFPGKNPLLVTNFAIVESDPSGRTIPQELETTARGRLWYLRGNQYFLPKCFVYVNFKCKPAASLENLVGAEVLTQLLSYRLTEISSYTELAALDVHLSLELTFKGFSQALLQLVRIVMDQFAELDCSDEVFETIRFGLAKDCYNSVLQHKCYAESIMATILQYGFCPLADKYKVLKAITRQEAMRQVREICNADIEAYMHGNITPAEARELFSYIESKLKPHQCEFLLAGSGNNPNKEYSLKRFANITQEILVRVLGVNTEEKCSRIMNYYVGGTRAAPTDELILQLLIIMIKADCILILRTSWQLGYDPACDAKCHNGMLGFVLSISPMADKFTLSYIDQKLDEFIGLMVFKFERLDRGEFEMAKDVLVKLRLSQCDSLAEGEEQKYWSQIQTQQYVFDAEQQQREARAIREIPYDLFRCWATRFLSCISTQRPKVSVQVVGYGKAALEECVGGEQIWKEYNEKPNKDVPNMDDDIPEVRVLMPKDAGNKRYVPDLNKLFHR